jgi:HEAT repeats
VAVPKPVAGKTREQWVDPAAIPALLQLLMAERTSTREVLVDVLGKIPGASAVQALARLAVFDIAPEVRDRAILALRHRPAESYTTVLLEGLRYPWPPAADHAAEALVALEDRAAVPSLIGLLDKPDPQGPTTVSRDGEPTTVVRSVVKINHLKNCLLCHDPSTVSATDLVRGRVPFQGQPLPPPRQYYGELQPGLYVRAEVTYLRQDFSVTQPVEGADPWPTQQRYDYLVYERPVPTTRVAYRTYKPKKEARATPKAGPTYPQRESVRFALRELTGQDPAQERLVPPHVSCPSPKP